MTTAPATSESTQAVNAVVIAGAASCSGAFLRDAFGLYFTPQSVLDAINPPLAPNIMDCICNPPRPK